MNAVKLEKAYISDKDDVLPMLNRVFGFDSKNNSTFDRLFQSHWGREETDPIGYLLREGNTVVGFYAYIMYQREIGGKLYEFCNMSTWGVEENYRGVSLQLVKPIKELSKTHTITNFTANMPSHIVFKRLLKFDDIENQLLIIPFLPSYFWTRHKIYFDRNIDQEVLSKSDHKIFNDHHPDKYKSVHVVLKKEDTYLYVILTKSFRKKIPFLEVRYINSSNLFVEWVNILRTVLPLKYRTVALLIDKRMMKGHNVSLSYTYNLPLSKLYKSPELDNDQIDGLYSEHFFS